MSTSSDDKKKEPSGFWDSFKEGYDEEDKKIRQDTAPLGEKIVDGLFTGTAETMAHPFRWIKSIFK